MAYFCAFDVRYVLVWNYWLTLIKHVYPQNVSRETFAPNFVALELVALESISVESVALESAALLGVCVNKMFHVKHFENTLT